MNELWGGKEVVDGKKVLKESVCSLRWIFYFWWRKLATKKIKEL